MTLCYTFVGACVSAAIVLALPLTTEMSPLSTIATAATGIVVAGICGCTASNYKNIANTNATAVDSIYNICEDGIQQKQKFPGVEYWEMV